MIKNYGFMVCEFDGDIEDLYCETEEPKPTTEFCGFSYAKWFDTEEKRNSVREYSRKAIEEKVERRNEMNKRKRGE